MDLEEILQKYVNEEFEYADSSLDFSCPKIEISIKRGEVYKGSFQVLGSKEKETKAKIYSSSVRFVCATDSFEGNEVIIPFQFDSVGMEEGEVLKGEIGIVSNKGEYYLPFVVTVEHAILQSSIGTIKNLFHFANLAKANWLEAVNLFYSKEFLQIFSGNDKKYYGAYSGLSYEYGNQRNVDEFLIEINKKQTIEYLLAEDEVVIDNPMDVTEGKLHITRNGWGCTYLEIEAEGSFLTVTKEQLTDDEFLGNHCELSYYVDSSKLHEGNNYGRIRLLSSKQTIEIPFFIRVNDETRALKSELLAKQRIVELTKYYLDFRMKKISTNTWLEQSMEIVEAITAFEEKNVGARLFQAQLLITKERFNEAKWILDKVENLLKYEQKKPELFCYYLYLMSLYNRSESYVDEITVQVEEIFKRNRNNWKIAWLLLYLKQEYSNNQAKRWAFLQELYQGGCRSPIIYMEGINLLHVNERLLDKLSGFDLQLLYFGAKHRLLDAKMITQIHYLLGRVKEFNEKLLTILISCYEEKEDTETLRAICMLLMKGNKTEEEHFKWYRLSVKENLRITRLYEYYMLSVPLTTQKALPRNVLMYFAYECNLPYERAAFLYANLLKNEEDFPEMVRSYREQIESFVVQQIKAEHINRDLAYLYQAVLSPKLITEDLAKHLCAMLFVHEICVEKEDMKQVVVVQSKLKGEVRYPIVGGRAFISVYSEDYTILVQDKNGNRYTKTIPYTIEKLLLPRKLLKIVKPFIQNDLAYDIFLCENIGAFSAIQEENAESFARILSSGQVRNEYKKEVRTKLIQYYYDNDKIQEMDEVLEKLLPNGTDSHERTELIRFMVMRGFYEKAMDWVKQFGVEGNDVKTILRLCSRILAREYYEKEDTMMSMVYYVFRHGKYNEYILQYLISYYTGLTKEMRDIWKAAVEFEVDAYVLSERILIQLLFSQIFIGERIQIYQYYIQRGARDEVQKAFLSYLAHEYFVKEKVIAQEVFAEFIHLYEQEGEVNDCIKLSLLKHFSEKAEVLSEKEKKMTEEFVNQLLRKQIYFSFYHKFLSFIPKLRMFAEQTIIEYRAKPDSRIMIHYVCQDERESNVQYKKQEMTNMYGGIFVKAFLLFFGEQLQYYITEEADGNEQLTESGTISKSDVSREAGESRFVLLNDIVLSKTLQDYETLDRLMEEYVQKDYMVSQLFELI